MIRQVCRVAAPVRSSSIRHIAYTLPLFHDTMTKYFWKLEMQFTWIENAKTIGATARINLRTNQPGIFPSAHVCEIDLVEEICMGALPSNVNQTTMNERDTFYLTMLASIEVAHHKGNDVLVQAMNKVLSVYQNREEIIVPQTVLMEVSFRGIHIIDKRRKNFFQCPTFDFFYSLQNISFCGAHPKQLRYFGFITKHPLLPRFACHVFLSNVSTQPIVESIGRAFKRSYDEYMAFAHPTEDIYLE
ncbi:unnamed protein product [Litomosoides sigmodontis]|uniref:PID domain-containing protein n=1 Tax=Litomosoides sigmodontis TaxID=42156 RepID=A0A3P6TU78_LITSI|nr:unnamed protein product [Litomosoides sigmodontis]